MRDGGTVGIRPREPACWIGWLWIIDSGIGECAGVKTRSFGLVHKDKIAVAKQDAVLDCINVSKGFSGKEIAVF